MANSLAFTLFKTKAIIIGRLRIMYMCWSKGVIPLQGIDMSNGTGDLNKAQDFKAQYYRFSVEDALQIEPGQLDGPYILMGPGAPSDDDYQNLAQTLTETWNQLKVFPNIIECSNEQNELTYQIARNVRSVTDFPVPVCKGPNTCCVEDAGMKAYWAVFKGEVQLDLPWIPEVFNYYQRPSWQPSKWFDNFCRRSKFAYLVTTLRNMNVQQFVITEAHDGSMTRKGYPDQGDYVYASHKGWVSIIKLCAWMGVDYVCYYTAAFLGTPGNTMLPNKPIKSYLPFL